MTARRGFGEGRYEVHWSVVHHGQHVPDRPWCVIWRTKPGTPGEPSDGIRYMRSFETRERAVQEVASLRAQSRPRVKRAEQRLAELYEEERAKMLAIVDRESPTGPPA